jgi:ubiquinone/menaquinone biosynthesis C-methylase UbiE
MTSHNAARERPLVSAGRPVRPGAPIEEGWQIEGDSAEAYETYLASAFRPWADDLIARAAVREGERVLDVASGTGIVARQAAPKVGPAGSVTGLDLNAGMLSVARTRSAGLHPAIEWRQASALEMPFPADAFDVVFCEQALQFFSDPVAALCEMHRVLAPGGRAAVNVCRPIEYSPAYVAMADALTRYVGAEAGAIMRSPFSRWTVDTFRGLFSDAGFESVRVTIETGALRYPSIQEFLRREAASSPLAASLNALDVQVRTALIRELESTLSDRVDDEGIACALELYVAVGRKAQ